MEMFTLGDIVMLVITCSVGVGVGAAVWLVYELLNRPGAGCLSKELRAMAAMAMPTPHGLCFPCPNCRVKIEVVSEPEEGYEYTTYCGSCGDGYTVQINRFKQGGLARNY